MIKNLSFFQNVPGTKKPAGIGPQHVVHLAICIRKTEDTASSDLNKLEVIARILPNLETLEARPCPFIHILSGKNMDKLR